MKRASSSATTCLLFTISAMLLVTSIAAAEKEVATREKRQLPLSIVCDPRQENTCHKGDLVDPKVADCKRTLTFFTCDPIIDKKWQYRNTLNLGLSSIVDVPDTSKNGVDCVPDETLPVTCGGQGTDTRCVCNKPVDWKQLKATLFNQCRCQYWPKVDKRQNKPSYCTQFDNGGSSGVHFYTCCDNCDDFDANCNGRDYQGGGSEGDYCGDCGTNTAKGGGRQTYSFNCVSCDQQKRCEEKCNKDFFGILASVPGFCPRWARCFRECCVEADQRLTAILQKYLD